MEAIDYKKNDNVLRFLFVLATEHTLFFFVFFFLVLSPKTFEDNVGKTSDEGKVSELKSPNPS